MTTRPAVTRPLTRALCVAVLPGLLAACGAVSGDWLPGKSDAGPSRYGAAPQPGGDVTYQPDVVFLDGGPDTIRSASSDGLTWLIDKDAGGADRLAVDKVLYASSLAVGRVAAIRPQGDQLAVTLAPVRIGEVIKTGRLKVSQPVNLTATGLRHVPDLPGATAELAPDPSATPTPGQPPGTPQPTPSDTPQPTPTGTPQPTPARGDHTGYYQPAKWTPPSDLPPPFTGGSAPWKAGAWSGEVTRDSGDVSFHVEHTGEGGLKADIDVGFHFASPHLDADLGIVDGEVGDSEIRLRGLREVTLHLRAGSVNGLSDNVRQKIEVPVLLETPVIVGGVAMNLSVRFKFLAQTAFTAKNSTLQASGAWTTEGPLSYDRASGKVTTEWPKVAEKQSIIDSLSGVSIGVNGFVFATEIRVMLGLGVPAVNAGPYARLVTSVGLTVGSDVGIVKCRQATVTVTAGTGVGLAMSDSVATGINAVLKRLGAVKEVTDDNTRQILEQEVYKNSFWSPDVPVCRLN